MVQELLYFFNCNSDAITSVAAVVAAIVAVYGVREWKRQLKGKTDYEIARRYLRTTLELRDAIKFVRNPFMSLGEMQSALKEDGFDSKEYEDRDKTNRSVYSQRWKKVSKAWSDLEGELLEAEISWGVDAINAQKNLNSHTKELFAALNLFLEGHTKKDQYGNELVYNMGDNDEFSKKIDNAVEEIKTFLRPHLI